MALPADDLTPCVIINRDGKSGEPRSIHSWPLRKSIAWRVAAIANTMDGYIAGHKDNVVDVYLMDEAAKGKLVLVPMDKDFKLTDAVEEAPKPRAKPIEIAAQEGIEFAAQAETTCIGRINLIPETTRPARKPRIQSISTDDFGVL